MPIGSSKLGVLGAGLVPGGSVTFNAPGTFSIPPGVKKVSITGKGATGNPGNAGTAGNPGNPGTGGAGGAAGRTNYPPGQSSGVGGGGGAFKTTFPGGSFQSPFPICQINRPASVAPVMVFGGINEGNPPPATFPKNSESGVSGSAGTAGNAGNPGNTGQSSSGLGNNFAGGAGGNAGVAGNAGTAGSGGAGGTVGQPGNGGAAGGAGGTGAGSGGAGQASFSKPGQGFVAGAGGGGGASTINDGQSGQNVFFSPPASPPNILVRAKGGQGLTTGVPVGNAINQSPAVCQSGPVPEFQLSTGGYGAVTQSEYGLPSVIGLFGFANTSPTTPTNNFNRISTNFSPGFQQVANNNLFRAGAGGGAGGGFPAIFVNNEPVPINLGGGGGGGGRGNAGNAGGSSPTPSGAAANPTTFNCVPVTPGSTAPITVASPGGQVIISWNPQ